MVNAMSDVLSTTTYSPYGVPDSPISGFAFTGEQRDTNGLQYHRARYYNAGLGTWASLDPFEGIHDRPMSLNGYPWVEGNVVNDAVGELEFHNRYSYVNGNPVNFVDPSGMIASSSQALNSGMCLSSPSMQMMQPILQSSMNYGWQCVGSNCQQWLEDAYNTLANSSNLMLQMLGSLLNQLGRQNSIPTAFHFSNPPGSGAITYSGLLVGLDPNYLTDGIASNYEISVLLHELWHTQQSVNDRITVWGEIDAYNLETNVMRAFGMTIPAWRVSLEQYGTPGMITRDLCSMCQARECLLSAHNHWLYSAEPVVNAPGRIFQFLTFAFLPADCPRLCPDTIPLTCT
jgi:RHS repeat-associated protein